MRLRISLVSAALLLALSPAGADAAPRKAKAAKAPSEVTVMNARKAVLSELAISNEAGVAVGSLTKPLEPGKKVTVKLGKEASCTVTILATFEDENDSEGQSDVCKDKMIRLHD